MVKSIPKIITLVGLVCIVVGIGWGFVDDATHFRFAFLSDRSDLFISTLLVGILLSFVGTVAWARGFENSKQLRLAGVMFVLGLASFPVAATDVHGTTALLFFVGPAALLLCRWFSPSCPALNRER